MLIARLRAVQIIVNIRMPLQRLGIEVALGGSCLYVGYSEKDVDLLLYLRDASAAQPELPPLYAELEVFGWTRIRSAETLRDGWRAKGSPDVKWVEEWQTSKGERVDLIYTWLLHSK